MLKRWRMTDGRTTDGRRLPVYTIGSSMSIRLRLATNDRYLENASFVALLTAFATFQINFIQKCWDLLFIVW